MLVGVWERALLLQRANQLRKALPCSEAMFDCFFEYLTLMRICVKEISRFDIYWFSTVQNFEDSIILSSKLLHGYLHSTHNLHCRVIR